MIKSIPNYAKYCFCLLGALPIIKNILNSQNEYQSSPTTISGNLNIIYAE